jgi:hypothetical protein
MPALLWYVKSCGVVEVYRHFRGMPPLSFLYKKEMNMEKCSMETGREIARIGTLHNPVGARRTVKTVCGP